MLGTDELGPLYDQPVNLDFDGRVEQVTVVDAVTLRTREDSTGVEGRVPIVVVEHADGRQENIDMRRFLGQINFNVDEYRSKQKQAALAQDARRKLDIGEAQNRDASRAQRELVTQENKNAWMFAPDAAPDASAGLYDAKLNQIKEPTDQTRRDAEARLAQVLQRDPEVASALRDYQRQHHEQGSELIDLVEAIRTDAGVRQVLGAHFLDLVKRLPPELSPRRVRSDGEKAGHYTGTRGKMNSTEYAALLALRMLDGSYDDEGDTSGADAIERDARGVATIGQHRQAAMQVLGLERPSAAGHREAA